MRDENEIDSVVVVLKVDGDACGEVEAEAAMVGSLGKKKAGTRLMHPSSLKYDQDALFPINLRPVSRAISCCFGRITLWHDNSTIVAVP